MAYDLLKRKDYSMTIEQIKKKIQYGDYTTLGDMLGLTPAAAKMRFFRGDEETKAALEKVIKSRERLIKQFSTRRS